MVRIDAIIHVLLYVNYHEIQCNNLKKLDDLKNLSNWKDATNPVPDWPRKEAVAKFRLTTEQS